MAAVARKLMKSEGLVARWAVKFGWQERVAAYAAHLAVVEREAVEATVRGKAAVWEQREQQLRETEWAMHQSAIAAAKRGLDEYLKKEKIHANLADIARMLEIASKLGRLATGLDKSNGEKSADAPQTLRVEVTVALEKIYGADEAEIVDVEEVPPVKIESREQRAEIPALCRDAATEGMQ